MIKAIFIVTFIWIVFNLQAQNNNILFSVNNTNIYKDEFLRLYLKNNSGINPEEQMSIPDYLQLYINFKLKVEEAKNLKLDTALSFKSEYEYYRNQVTTSYVTDKNIEENLINEAYNRLKTEIRLFHILIKVSHLATPHDTLVAYNKALKVRNKIKTNDDFLKIAPEVSDDQSVARNKGDLWYISAFQAPNYTVENYIYNTKIVNQISEPIRSEQGYHLVKIIDIRPNPGMVKVAHIMLLTSSNENDLQKAESDIKAIYNQAISGADFSELAKIHSQDKGTGTIGGELPWFTTGQMVREFETAAFKLTNKGDISAPVKTLYGWHIIKLLDKKQIPSIEELHESLKTKIQSTDRFEACLTPVIEKTKQQFGFTDQNNYSYFFPIVDSTIFQGKWENITNQQLNDDMFSLGNQKYTQKHFADYLYANQKNINPVPIPLYVTEQYKKFQNTTIINYYKQNLENTDSNFKLLMQEYFEGMLLFEITNLKIWSKAATDSIGLEKFYKQNDKKYTDSSRIEIVVYKYANSSVEKEANRQLKKYDNETFEKDKLITFFSDTTLISIVNAGEFTKNSFAIATNLIEQLENGEINPENKIYNFPEQKCVAYLINSKINQKVPLHKIRGIVTNDYQNYLEEQWIKELRSKYTIKINQIQVNALKSEFNQK